MTQIGQPFTGLMSIRRRVNWLKIVLNEEGLEVVRKIRKQHNFIFLFHLYLTR
jgi:hypothetical protein